MPEPPAHLASRPALCAIVGENDDFFTVFARYRVVIEPIETIEAIAAIAAATATGKRGEAAGRCCFSAEKGLSLLMRSRSVETRKAAALLTYGKRQPTLVIGRFETSTFKIW